MINLEKQEIAVGGVTEPIQRWEVWFHTPWGMASSFKEAADACEREEIPVENAIIPMAVAIGATKYEVSYRAH
jgi:hypothetical protein